MKVKKTNIKLIVSIALIILTFLIFINTTYAFNPDDYNVTPPTKDEAQGFLAKAGKVIAVVRNVGVIVSVLALAAIGIKYMFSSVEGKAEYKKTMIPYIVGCIILMSASIIVGIIQNIAEI